MNSRKLQSRDGEDDESGWVGNVFVYFNFNNSMDFGTADAIVDASGVSGGGDVTEVDGRPYSILVSTTGPEVQLSQIRDSILVTPVFKKDGNEDIPYQLAGFATSPNSSVIAFDPDGSVANGYIRDAGGTVSLYAVWRPTRFMVEFKQGHVPGGTEGSMANMVVSAGA